MEYRIFKGNGEGVLVFSGTPTLQFLFCLFDILHDKLLDRNGWRREQVEATQGEYDHDRCEGSEGHEDRHRSERHDRKPHDGGQGGNGECPASSFPRSAQSGEAAWLIFELFPESHGEVS